MFQLSRFFNHRNICLYISHFVTLHQYPLNLKDIIIGMASQANAISLFSHKSLYSQQLMYISPLRCSKICMSILPSGRPCVKASITYAEKVIDLASPLSITNTMSFAREVSSHLVDHHGMKAIISPQVDANKRMHELKENTRRALMMTSDPKMTLKLIDTIQRLGVGYCFEEEIKNILENLTQVLPDDDLYTVALNFRLRRQGGLHTNPAEVFQNFMDANRELKKSSSEDIEGLLSLYEASHLGSSGEDVLSHAKEITTRHLNKSVSQLNPKLHKKVVEGLKLPRHMRMQRLEARRYIEEYGNEDDHNPLVLEFAKYDYNKVQSVLQMELVEVTRWWEHLGLSSKLGFRDRHVECFLWTVGLLPELSFSGSRIDLAKAIAIMLVIDDIYDTYGSYEDLLLFTDAIQRWDLEETEQLPEYMKICFEALYNTNNGICDKVLNDRGLSVQPFLRKTWVDLVKAYMVEAEWLKRSRIPTLKEYIENGVTTSGACMALVHLFFLVSNGLPTKNMPHLLDRYPSFFTLAGTILRLWDDLGTVKEEQERGDMLSSIHLLMKEKNIACEKEGRNEILQMIYSLWNDLNTELVTPDIMLFPIIKVALNISRASQVVYEHGNDSYLSSVENHVQSLFYKPIDI
ncbi:monoterpene synthase TPS4, chloroplastic-like isoform X2 [Bidens hawaiensis]|uniref:monoterpene synthase TPS4, chloroplastic-like isoform X2 n=1 Tax=Bidens hawaiensis TaxID=980011 RepID=UPI00404A20A6